MYFSSINYPSKKIEREQQDIQYEKSVEKRAVPMVSKNFDSPSATIRTNWRNFESRDTEIAEE